MSLLDDRHDKMISAFAGYYDLPATKWLSPLALDVKLDIAYSGKLALEAHNYLEISKLHNMANVTPNGMMMPKWENEIVYTSFARNFFRWTVDTGIFNRFKAWNVPAIRYKEASLKRSSFERPRASEHAHSDSWLGWDKSAIVFMLPLAGDVKNNWVQFFDHPLDETWIEVLPTFNHSRAREMLTHCVGLPWAYEIGHIYPNDIGIVHQTRRENGSGWRVSAEIVGYLDYPSPDSFGYQTAFTAFRARRLAEGYYKFKANLKMGEIGDYSETGRALDVEIADA